MKKINIAVSGINATDNPGPGIPVAKSLRQSDLDCQLIGLSYDINDPGHYLDKYLDCSFILPYPTKGWRGMMERLEHIKKHQGLDIIIPCLDVELPMYIKYADQLKGMGIETYLPDMKSFELRNKANLTDVAKAINSVYPETWKVYSLDELIDVCEKEDYPLVIKGQYYKAYIVYNIDAATKYYHSLAEEWGLPILVQKVVSGEELNVVGVGDGEGGSLGMVAIRKQSVTDIGKVWSAVTIKNDDILESAEAFINKYKWQGPFELEYIVNNKSIQLIEINPRFPAWVYFAAGLGINLPERVVKLMLGMSFDRRSDYQPGMLYMRYTDEVICNTNSLQELITHGGINEREK